MQIEIKIECEDKNQILQHLQVIRKQIKKDFNEDNIIKEPFECYDNNCYGTHDVKITEV